ncbi:MAG TPA: sporulation protein YqfC [Firmicutes bacterium]|jgi:sporulation protein YqfC|nr:sporulation protein YqfC [Bacillota bacterium]HBT17179.1 sporulation protein YqfC [Bacillota bacterium]
MRVGKQGKGKRFKAKVADFFELPSDVILDLPRLVLTGNQRLLIENHQGIIEYAKEVIRINTPIGELRISGEDLKIILITQEQVSVEGQIDKLDWRERGEDN